MRNISSVKSRLKFDPEIESDSPLFLDSLSQESTFID